MNPRYDGGDKSAAIAECQGSYSLIIRHTPHELSQYLRRNFVAHGPNFRALKIFYGVNQVGLKHLKDAILKLENGGPVDLENILEH